ncbi:Conserved protein of unknown function; putative proteasome-type protease domain [Magnetospira sp. QH-2]|nr:peptidase [Magnetospira sp. QH-2]CCQ73577.1 Conserved protein of unknown function; putative proteasome-type protease domain [Magnetospira sp. QH-2]
MTYCVGLYLDEGLVMLADTRTNAGVDNISTYSKTYIWEKKGDRVIVLMTAGNLAITQAVVNLVEEGLPPAGDPKGERETMYTVPSMFQAARLVGRAVRQVYDEDAEALRAQDMPFAATFLIGGQLAGRTMRLAQVYAAGNFIAATQDTPFLQIGEHKYGKPILDRALAFGETTVKDGVKLALLSMDSTVRSNLSVGFPLDLVVYRKGALEIGLKKRIDDNDPYFQELSTQWSETLRAGYQTMPSPDWA